MFALRRVHMYYACICAWNGLRNGFELKIIENYNVEFKFFSISVRAKSA